jgi:ribosomal protein S18 acetylase RimI-like enzyme
MSQPQTVSTRAHLDALTAADFEELAQLAETIWRAHYKKIISSAQIAYMLAGRYTPERLRLYLNADDRWLTLLRVGNETIGYCSNALTDDPGGMKPVEMKLEQLYLLPELHGKGFGKLMLRHVEEQAKARGCRTLLLQVNKHNDIAVDFYRKAGFIVREEAVFDIGNGFVMDDYVMEKAL